jgi:hypothetical protein
LAYRLMGIGFELVMATLLFCYLRRRVRPLLAAFAVIALMGNGQAAWDYMWPFEVTFTISLAAGVGALMLLDVGTRLGRLGAAACIVVSVASSGFGLVFIAAICAESIWSALCCATSGNGQWRAGVSQLVGLWPLAPGLGVELAWYFQAHVHDVDMSYLGVVPRYVLESAGYGVGSLAGLYSLVLGEVLAVAIAGVLAVRLASDWRSGGRLVMAVAAAVTFWTLDALARSGGVAAAGRYFQPDGLFAVLAVAELGTGRWAHGPVGATQPVAARLGGAAPGWPHPAAATGRRTRDGTTRDAATAARGRARTRAALSRERWWMRAAHPVLAHQRTVLVVVAPLVVVLAVWSNSATLVHQSLGLRIFSVTVKGDLRAVQIAGDRLSPSFHPLPVQAPQITVGGYLSAVAALGSPADTVSQLREAPEAVRASADELLVTALKPVLRPLGHTGEGTSGPAAPEGGPTGRCVRAPDGRLQLALGPGGLLVEARATSDLEVRLRLFASVFPTAPVTNLRSASAASLVLQAPVPHLPGPLWAQVTAGGGVAVVACQLLGDERDERG